MSGRVQGIKGGREREEGETGKESFEGLGTNKTKRNLHTGLEVVWKPASSYPGGISWLQVDIQRTKLFKIAKSSRRSSRTTLHTTNKECVS